MQNQTVDSKRVRLSISLFVIGIVGTLLFSSNYFGSKTEASPKKVKGIAVRTESHQTGIENYDIRLDKSDDIVRSLLKFRRDSGKSASAIADSRKDFVDGENALKQKVSNLKVEYNLDIRIPEVIAPDVKRGRAFLTSKSNLKRSKILRNFVTQNDSLIGINSVQANDLKVAADYTNPKGNMSFAHLEQDINGIPVFRGEIKAGFTKDGEIVRVINNLAPGLDYDSLSTDFKNPLDAVKAAAASIRYELQRPDVSLNQKESTELKKVFGNGDWATTAEKMYFPTEPGVARAAWRVLIWQPINAYYIIVDAETGLMLWRKNITEDQTQSATYEVYDNVNSYTQFAESPAPLTPGPINPGTGTQGALLIRTNVTLIGNEGDLSFNNNGWIDDGGNTTAGNNTIAGIDIVPPNGVDAPVTGVNRTFSSAWNPPPGNPAPGDVPTVQAARDGAVIQMFYVMNRYHDALYKLGFTEQAFNFQNNNFGRGGNGNDRVSSEGQDSSGTNNANFSTPADGVSGRMQMFRFTGANPDRDGTTDVDIIIHEATHGTSNRLHGNASGLSSNMSRGMGEGWSDWYGHVLTSEPSDPINGVYTVGGYVLLNTFGLGSTNYYYGIRRFPKAVIAFTGGVSNRPHNPLTFADLNAGCIISDGAFGPAGGGACDQVHNAGEIWSSMLWEVRSIMVTRLGFQTGTERVLQVVTDGMKLAPLSPNFVQERDAIITAARANGNSPTISADVVDIWEGFRRRGMGFSAEVNSAGPPAVVTEAFDSANLAIQESGFAVNDSSGDNDGFPEPGEPVQITIPLVNNTGINITGVTVNVNGGANVSYGDIADGTTVTRQISFTVPGGTTCGSALVLDLNINGSAGARTETRTFIVGQPNAPDIENFDGVTAPALPANWSAAATGAGVPFVTRTNLPDSAPNSAFVPNNGQAGGNNGSILESKDYAINSEAATVSFRNRYDTEANWDGGVLEFSINGGTFQDIIAGGGSFLEGGYNGTLGVNQNPLNSRSAWTGDSGGYITTTALLPTSTNGQTVKFRWRFGEDTNTFSVGWDVDNIEVSTGYTCAFTPSSGNARFDYDGDGKTDVSIFRPNLGQWWYLQSSDNSSKAFTFGQSTDKITPADFTGDNKTDIAIWRENTGEWFVLRSEDSTFFAFPFGTAGDIPVPGDFDGDGKADAAVFRPATATWFISNSTGGTTTQAFGLSTDVPTVEDFDGDGKDDIAIYRPSAAQFWQLLSQDGVIAYAFGAVGDKAVPADFTGDGKADVAIWRETTGEWFILRSEDSSFFAFPFGLTGDIPVPGDYDGDGKADAAIFRPSNSRWFKQQSTNGFEQVAFGTAGDIPTPAAFIP